MNYDCTLLSLVVYNVQTLYLYTYEYKHQIW